ncbi:hypothetical protein Zm00014a_021779 [Zea mays]|uniref:Uncharacterized protein n=2 Tax=Zea mays TaxID=4577 RepID=A0A3L6G8L1_MAIZE|nr:hypothetical protein Zm00014a_006415 [Zea mays]PWZ44219.1 hypothetical protein Zm00014a_021779 [Zea mays]
MPQSMPQNNP